ncbi:MAG TPA: condensation domain-containing protein, partial [Terriglobales bacterium]
MSSNPSLATAAFRLSHQQERAWSQHERGVTQFAQCSIAIEGKLDAARLQSAITSVVSKYEILRTQLRRQSGIKLPFQTIQEAADFHFEQAAAEDIARAMQSEHQQLLQSEQGAPLRARLIGHDPARHTLILTLPVFCADSTTLERLVSEISAAYGDGEQESDDPMQYVDLAEWQNELLASDEVKPGRTFWRTHCNAIDFASVQNAALPFEQKSDGTFAPASLMRPSSDLPTISALASGLEVGAGDVLLSAWDALLMRLLARQDVTVGCDFDGRRYDELKAALGPLARTLPLRSQVSADAPFSALLNEVRLLVDEARNWQESFSWGQLFENDAPDVPFSFSYQDLGSSSEAGDVRFTLERVYVISERFKLRLVAVRRRSELTLEFHYDSSRLSRSVVERIAGWYQNLLAAAVANPATPISKLPLLSEAERRQLLIDWNQTAASYPADQCLHQLFETQAASTPSREALRFGEQA